MERTCRLAVASAITSVVGLVVAACGSSSKPAASPGPSAASTQPAAVTADCADFEHQVDLCRPTCPECAGDAPGNSCNVCAEACAQQLWCSQCGATDGCDEGRE